MTDNEIIKALDCCKTNNCDECPFYGVKEDCEVELPEEAFDLINRQKAIIEKSEKVEHFADKTIETANAEIERLLQKLQQAKSEAIKEFAARLKCGVPQETGVIMCADVDNLVKEMTEV